MQWYISHLIYLIIFQKFMLLNPLKRKKAGVLNVIVGCWMLNEVCTLWRFPKEGAPVNSYAEYTAASSLFYIGWGWSNRKYNPKEVDLTCVKRLKRCYELADKKENRKDAWKDGRKVKMKWRPWARNLFWQTVSANC